MDDDDASFAEIVDAEARQPERIAFRIQELDVIFECWKIGTKEAYEG